MQTAPETNKKHPSGNVIKLRMILKGVNDEKSLKFQRFQTLFRCCFKI